MSNWGMMYVCTPGLVFIYDLSMIVSQGMKEGKAGATVQKVSVAVLNRNEPRHAVL